ncbi:hypothetical protein GCM10010486_60100 [Nonomuraea roseoviolacea subsp. carminata]
MRAGAEIADQSGTHLGHVEALRRRMEVTDPPVSAGDRRLPSCGVRDVRPEQPQFTDLDARRAARRPHVVAPTSAAPASVAPPGAVPLGAAPAQPGAVPVQREAARSPDA